MAVALVHPETPLENLVLALLGSASLLSLGWGLILQLTIDYCYRASSSEAQGRLRTHLLVGHIFTCALAHCTLNLCRLGLTLNSVLLVEPASLASIPKSLRSIYAAERLVILLITAPAFFFFLPRALQVDFGCSKALDSARCCLGWTLYAAAVGSYLARFILVVRSVALYSIAVSPSLTELQVGAVFVNVALNTFITLHLLLDRRRNTPSRSQASPDAISKLARSTLSNLSLVWAAQVSFAACTLLYYLNGSLRAGFAGQAVGHLVAVLAAISTLCTIISDMPHCDHLRAIKGSADDPGTWMGTRSFVAEGRATIDPPRVEVVVMPPMEGASGGEGYEINGGVEKVGGLGLQRDTSSVSALSVGTTELLLNESALETCVARHLRPRVRPKVGSVSFGSAEQDVVRPAE